MISSGNIDWPTLIANSESLASAFEQEQDRAEKQSATSGERHRGTEIVTRHRVHGAFPRPSRNMVRRFNQRHSPGASR
jgi:hypothetical protein